uniref:Uncharacterized protein n=1 Tax=Romanomermis culicivorax TaxID=13658 RepID=A0A915HLH3_ROMCU
MINQHIAEQIRYAVDSHTKSIPAVLEIPSKDHPYDPSKDSVLHRARGMFNPEEFPIPGAAAAKGRLIAMMGDEDTCVGFLLGGVGELNKSRQPNYMVVDKNTSVQEIEDCFR